MRKPRLALMVRLFRIECVGHLLKRMTMNPLPLRNNNPRNYYSINNLIRILFQSPLHYQPLQPMVNITYIIFYITVTYLAQFTTVISLFWFDHEYPGYFWSDSDCDLPKPAISDTPQSADPIPTSNLCV